MIKVEIHFGSGARRRLRMPTRRGLFVTAMAVCLALPVLATASQVSVPHEFMAGDIISAAEFNENFEAIADAINDNDARLAAVETAVDGLGVPVGTIAFFAMDVCPAGWDEHSELRGRVPVGLPVGGTVSLTQGLAFADGEQLIVTDFPAHSHSDGSLSGTAASAGTHNHTMNSAGSHTHDLSLETGGAYGSYAPWGSPNNFGGDVTGSALTYAGAHTHFINSGGSHTHSVSIVGSTGTAGVAGGVDVTTPYVQLLACEKA